MATVMEQRRSGKNIRSSKLRARNRNAPGHAHGSVCACVEGCFDAVPSIALCVPWRLYKDRDSLLQHAATTPEALVCNTP